MSKLSKHQPRPSVGIIGFGAFGRLIALHLAPFFVLRAYDPALKDGGTAAAGIVPSSLGDTARCEIVVLATPVESIERVLVAVVPHLSPGALVLDVGSVKVGPAALMRDTIPDGVDVAATHPLFGPQSARDGLRGLKIAVCPIRGLGGFRVAAFLRKVLCLHVIVTEPEIHDREAALTQGLTHMVARMLVEMGPLPTRFTTRSFDLLVQAAELVRHDAPEVFDAILRANPYAAEVQRRFFGSAKRLEAELIGRASR